MSLRFRKSMKLMPGVRLNFSKSTVGMSFGIPGARYTINSKGRRTISTGIPGTGIYNVETINRGTHAKKASRSSSDEFDLSDREAPSPGVLAKKYEKEFHRFLLEVYDSSKPMPAAKVIENAKKLRNQYQELRYPLELISFLHGITDPGWKSEARLWGVGIWKNRKTMFADRLVEKYFAGIYPMVTISPGIATQLTYNEQTLGFIWVEILQGQSKYDEALEILHQMNPDQMVAISIADIEISKRDFDGALETTEDVEVFDDATAMLIILRGVAFREKGMNEAAIECFKRALKSKKHPKTLQHRGLFERGVTYVVMGKKALAVKDFERILVDDPKYPEVEKKLAKIKG